MLRWYGSFLNNVEIFVQEQCPPVSKTDGFNSKKSKEKSGMFGTALEKASPATVLCEKMPQMLFNMKL